MLKPVRDLIDLLDYAFQEGTCQCVSCASGEDQDSYPAPHNFNIDGVAYRRQFAKSSKDDLSAKMKAALKSFYKDEEIDFALPLEESKLTALLDEKEYKLFVLLGDGNDLIKGVADGKIAFNKI